MPTKSNGRDGSAKRFSGQAEAPLYGILADIIAAGGGKLTFADFMREALYHPQHGYYQQVKSPVGVRGDFFTAVSATPLFGRILAGYFTRLRAEMGHPDAFTVVEYGGHRGQLRDDVLSAAPDLAYNSIDVGGIEPASIVGCVFSNELLDAFPVHRMKVIDGSWQEIYVTVEGDGFAWSPGPCSDDRLLKALAGLPLKHMEGYETEVNLEAPAWIERIGQKLKRGRVVTIDYGFERHEYYSAQRPRGTLRCYAKHTVSDNPLVNVGKQDITAHIDFTSIIEAGRKVGLEPVLFTDLSHFLLQEGEPILREISERTAGTFSSERSGIHQLLHPGLMGSAFKVLVQEKMVPMLG